MLRWLFVDMNAYFASVEQHLRPELRGKPVAVVAVDTDSTSCIAASYEAKPFGIRTGTPVDLARHLCPGLKIVVARPPLYVDCHHQILAVIENHLHVDKILSIDEVACRLPSNESSEANARKIAMDIKRELREKIGPCIRCSVGIAPNRFLAKLASDMQKPDGLTVLRREDLPGKILRLGVRDLPGVGPNMEVRLAAYGADTMAALWGFSEDQLARAWGGVGGRDLWRNLHGEHVLEIPTQRRTIGHSNVLSPELRTEAGAYAVLVRLVHKAAARLRNLGYAAGNMSLHVRYTSHPGWDDQVGIDDAQDTQTLLDAMRFLWNRRPPSISLRMDGIASAPIGRKAAPTPPVPRTPKKVGVTLFDLALAKNLTLPLFPLDHRRLELARAMDDINGLYGRQRIYFGEMHETRKAAPMRIAFNSVPDENW